MLAAGMIREAAALTTQISGEVIPSDKPGCLAMAAGAEPDPGGVRIAVERIHHRGPDDDGFYSDADIALGIKRLAIIDLSAGGRQPMPRLGGRDTGRRPGRDERSPSRDPHRNRCCLP